MRSIAGWLGAALWIALLAVPPVAKAGDEVILVEPINAQLINLGFTAAQTIYQITPVNRPETICGNPGGDPNKLIPCYEFAMTYFSYDSAGRQVVHLPECNGVGPLDPSCETSNLCASRPPSFLPIGAPVCGDDRVDVLPLTTSTPLTLGPQPTSTWDGTSRTPLFLVFFDYTSSDGRFVAWTYHLPLIRIPRSAVVGGAPVIGIVIGRHTSLAGDQVNFGFFDIMNRVFPYNQTLGDVTNLVPEPLLFQ